jgi:anti-sigma-K factor RskA
LLPFGRNAVHTSTDEQVEELAATAAAGSMTAAERSEYLAHTDACALCRRLAGEMQAVANALPLSLEPRQATPGLKARTLAITAASDRAGPTSSFSTAPEAAGKARTAGRRGLLLPAALAAAAVFAVAFAGALAWGVSLRSDSREQAERLANQERLLDAIAGGGTVTHLEGTSAAPRAHAAVIHSADGRGSFMLVSNLPALPEGQEYQVWNIKDSSPAGAGVFSSGGMDDQLVILASDLRGADAIGVSIEPAGGSPAPTGAIVLLGSSG